LVPVKRRVATGAADSRVGTRLDWSKSESPFCLYAKGRYPPFVGGVALGLRDGELMLYQHCPRCRLAIRCRASYLALEHCPRCLGRAGILTAMFTSPLNAAELRAAAAEGEPAISAQAAREAARPRAVRRPRA
jgi:hypothetical protein